MDYFPVYYIYCRFNPHIHDLIHLWLVPNQEAFGLFGPWDGCRARLPLQRTCHLTSGRARTLQAAAIATAGRRFRQFWDFKSGI